MSDPARQIDADAADGRLLLSVADVARLLGGVGERTVWRWADSGRMPRPLRVGGRRLWRRHEIQRWVEAGCPKIAR